MIYAKAAGLALAHEAWFLIAHPGLLLPLVVIAFYAWRRRRALEARARELARFTQGARLRFWRRVEYCTEGWVLVLLVWGFLGPAVTQQRSWSMTDPILVAGWESTTQRCQASLDDVAAALEERNRIDNAIPAYLTPTPTQGWLAEAENAWWDEERRGERTAAAMAMFGAAYSRLALEYATGHRSLEMGVQDQGIAASATGGGP